ncbi:MAG: sigma-70 family RNA polymerase sigma factor [Candidatus Omnitrophota bacterium]
MSDLELIQGCVKRDKQSWEQFVSKYSRLIYSYIYNILNSKARPANEQNIKDIYQELLFVLIKDNFKKLKSYKGRNGCSLASWLRQVTINFTIDYLRKIKPTVSINEEKYAGFILQDRLSDNAAPIHELMNDGAKLSDLKECIEGLDLDDKYFLELSINRNLNLEQLKNHFKVSRGTIDMRKSRIIKRLKECFRSKYKQLDF